MHTWVGLPLGWVFFFIFVSGAISYYHPEITLWMQPETHQARPTKQAANKALDVLRREAPANTAWTITLPSERAPYAAASWRDPSAAPNAGRMAMKRVIIDPSSGEQIAARETAGGSFLYRLHYQLYGLDRDLGMRIIGVITLFMLLALVSGPFAHRTIFKDFFLFRPGRGNLSWRDAHNATAVLSYPFHIVLTISGLVLLATSMMTPVIQTNYGEDARSFFMAMRGMPVGAQAQQQQPRQEGGQGREGGTSAARQGAERQPNRSVQAPSSPMAQAEITDLSGLLAQAAERWPSGAGTIVINNQAGGRQTIELRQAKPGMLSFGAGANERMSFDAHSGELLQLTEATKNSAVMSIWQGMIAVHRGHFAGPLARFLLFASGLCGAGMMATGLIMWSLKRKNQVDFMGRVPLSRRLVESLNIAAIPGLFTAMGCYFTASRLIPAEIAGRADLERQVFFVMWGLCLAHALLRYDKKKAWAEQLAAAGTTLALLPLINAMTGGAHLAASLSGGLWPIAGFDLCALLFGISFLLAAKKIVRQTKESKENEKVQLSPAQPA